MKIFPACCLVYFLPSCSALAAAKDPVARLQESFTADQAERRQIYSEVVSLADRRSAGDTEASRSGLLASAVALKQMAMDAEDEFLESMKSSAPGFRKLAWDSPEFVSLHRRASERFKKLCADYPFVESYRASSSLVAGQWQDGLALLQAAVSFRDEYPHSRFWKRAVLLAGCRLLLEHRYDRAGEAFRLLWAEDSFSPQAVDACSLVDALEGDESAGRLRLTPAQRLAWGKALGLSGNSALDRLIKLYPGTGEAEEAYYRIFLNINQGFAMRPLSSNYLQAGRFDEYFKSFIAEHPESNYLDEALGLRAGFHYFCGKKSNAIARKNDYRWRTTKRSSNRKVSQRYFASAERHFQQVAAVDSMAGVRFPGSGCCFRVGIVNVRAMFERDQFVQAEAKLQSLLARGPDSLSLNTILWYGGLIHYLRSDFQVAVDCLSPLEQAHCRDTDFWSRGMLFLGKSYLATGDTLAAARVFGLLSRTYPYTYYGIRARSLKSGLSLKIASPGWLDFPLTNLARFPDSCTGAGARFQQEAKNWQSLGFFAEAAYIYANALREVPDDLLLRYRSHENYLLAGWYHRVLRGFRGAFREFLYKGGNGLPANFWELAYLNPEPYREFIARESARFNVPRSLITAVIRQESNFNEQARSHAGARGLMQLLPSVGRRLSSGMGLGRITNLRLYDPEVSLALGVKFLAGNLSKYDGNIALAISCYNADPRNLPVWLERMNQLRHTGDFDLDLFVELIPLDETHDYNIQVLTNFWRYQEVYKEARDFFGWKLDGF
ncbi:MAG: lytic transglycosylase domain-containing protein [Candidatus Glassbacteria bacterium]|nr:lytic transglycosylase domain-containing protein [Candidatus Glassbacteria bacterium]